jgi:hypothetical protein
VEFVFALIDRMRQELVLDELANPDSERQTEFAFGRIHGILFALSMMQQELAGYVEEQGQRQDRMEREF